MSKYIMALDQGTTSSRCILFDKKGNSISSAQKEYTQIFPKPGWVEHDPMEIWSSQLSVAVEAMGKVRAHYTDIAAIGITNQRETTILWDRKTGEPVYNAIVWQCRRTADRIEKVKAEGMDSVIKQRTGLVADAYFSASKIAWILENVEGTKERAKKGELAFGTVDTWLIWNLTKGAVHVTDYSNASRTMLFDIHKKCWDQELLDYFDIPASILPEVKPSSFLYGKTSVDVFGGEIPISGAAGDQQAALFGQCCFQQGEMKNTYGTGCFLLMNTGNVPVESNCGLVTTIAASISDDVDYALEGSVFVAGAAVQWLRDEMRMVRSAPQTAEYCEQVEDTGGVYLVPAFSGLGTPYWNPYARGIAVGITRGTSKEYFIRATVESIAYQVYDLIEAMGKDFQIHVKELRVDGGASINDFLMQFQSDITGAHIIRPACIETTALGAAYLAGLAVGYWADLEEIKQNWQISREFQPKMEEEKKHKLIKGWKRAVKAAIVWAEEEE